MKEGTAKSCVYDIAYSVSGSLTPSNQFLNGKNVFYLIRVGDLVRYKFWTSMIQVQQHLM